MLVNIQSLINKLSKNINTVTVLKEAIVNSIQANATRIDLVFKLDADILENGSILSMNIFDNGDGFTEENIKSFSTYGSDHKLKDGCKGIGRITYLKIFKKVILTSFCKNKNNTDVCVSLDFTPQFTQNSFKIEDGKQDEWWKTHLHFEKPYKQKNLDIKLIRDDIYYHLLPLLFLKKEKNIQIQFYAEDRNGEYVIYDNFTITTQNLPALEKKNFEVGPLKLSFTLSYHFKKIEKNESTNDIIKAFYCANKRTVMPFSKLMSLTPIKNVMTIFLLESSLLDERVNDERNEFNIDKKNPDLEAQISWVDINENLKNILNEIIDTNFPEIKEKKRAFLEEIAKGYPYLIGFLDKREAIGGVFEEDDFIKNAENKYSQEKLSLRKNLLKNKGKPEDNLQKTRNFASLELTQYIQFRDYILQQFTELTKPTTLEKEIHNLFIPQKKTASRTSPLPLKENNLWILDDKFMSYNYLQSDKEIKEFLSEVNLLSQKSTNAEINIKDKELHSRPDIAIYFDSKLEKFDSESAKRAVLIEFKRPIADYKNAGINQLSHYSKVLTDYGVNEMYMYLISEIDNAFEDELRTTYGFAPIFSPKGKIYQRSYLPHRNAHIQVMSLEAVIENAKARNHTFMEVINKDLSRQLSIITNKQMS
ncbi:ATP-binding protein [Bartonella sp. CB74]|uniref:ATP-binding protein n=1 Tax=Bartonella sp. CB74 TaxID=3113620 RepID=UPI002F96C61A